MKLKTLFTFILLVTVTGVFAQPAERLQTKKQNLTSFNRINVDAQVDVVLIDDKDAGDVYFVGDSKLFEDIKLSVENNELKIFSKKSVNYKSKLTVEVHVKDLTKITIQKDALVFSGNTLHSKKINVYIKGGSKASLQSTGNIYITSEEDTELVFAHRTAGVTVVNE